MIHSDSNEVRSPRISSSAIHHCQRVLVATVLLISISFVACDKSNRAAKGADVSGLDGSTPILLFTGVGTSQNDVAAVETILNGNHLNYLAVNSSQLNQMSESQIRGYRLLIVPGGNFIDMGKSLTASTAANIHRAVQNGLNYLGICAGGFLAGDSAYYNGFNLTSGVKFGFYSAENQGIRKAAVAIARAEGPTVDQYWEDGPQFTGWGTVVAKYPDGTPAIVQGAFGGGWVILVGVHSEAPENWRRGMTFATSTREDNAYAGMLIQAALARTSLAHY